MSRRRGAATSRAASAGSSANGASTNISTSSRSTSICRNNPSDGTEEGRGMTYYGGKEMAASFRTVRDNTIKIAEEIPESKYDFAPAPDCRTIGKTPVHIALGPTFQHHIQSNKISDIMQVNFSELSQKVMAEEAKPRTKAETIAFLKTEGDKFAAFLESLPESFLAEQVKMPPQAGGATKSRFEMLLG